MDGKMIRQTVGLLSLVDQETGVARGMIPISAKEGDGENCELKAAQTLINQGLDLDGQLVTADSLHAQQKTAQAVKESGGQYLLAVKENQPGVLKRLEKKLPTSSPFLKRRKNQAGG